jgi:type II secretory ATPase GspE/PulE/Tfp pilus assembly ATPase PilB-like protein
VDELPEGPFYESEGCDECLDRGFTGRVALFEMLLVTEHLRDFIARGVPAHVLSKEAVKAGMPTLFDHGLQLARAGRISLMEIARVVSD